MSAPPVLDCRMYEAKFPEVDDVVMVMVREEREREFSFLFFCLFIFFLRPPPLFFLPPLLPTPPRSLPPRQQVNNIAEMGAYVSLLEYAGAEGMILLSELSRRRIRSINKLIKVGRQEPVVVLRGDRDKGYIDLSKRRVSPEEAAACEEKFNKVR